MKKSFLLFAIAAIAFTSCTKSDVAPPAALAVAPTLGASAKAKPVTPPPTTPPAPAAGGGSGKGGGGNGGGTAAPAPTNLQVFTKWLTGSWQCSIAVALNQPTIVLNITFNANGTFTAITTDNSNGAHTTFSGNWQLTNLATPSLTQSAMLVLTNGKTTIMSGPTYFVRPGDMLYTTNVNTLAPPIGRTGYTFIKT